jgi:hypothetical protein
LSIDPNTGVISGVIDPQAAGTFAVTVSATDDGRAGSTSFTWTVGPSGPVSPQNVAVLLGPVRPLKRRHGGIIPGRFTQTVQLFVTGSQSLVGPITLALENLPVRRVKQHGHVHVIPLVRLTNANGVTVLNQPGSPFVRTSAGATTNQVVTFVLQFKAPSRRFVRYTPQVFSGTPKV